VNPASRQRSGGVGLGGGPPVDSVLLRLGQAASSAGSTLLAGDGGAMPLETSRSRPVAVGSPFRSPAPSCLAGCADGCIARTMRKSNRARLTSDAALLFL
jgi:hypothetical protein